MGRIGNIARIDIEAGAQTRKAVASLDTRLGLIEDTFATVVRNGVVVLPATTLEDAISAGATATSIPTFSNGMLTSDITSTGGATVWKFISDRNSAFSPCDAYEFKVTGSAATIDVYHTKWTTAAGTNLMGLRIGDSYLELPGLEVTQIGQLTSSGITYGAAAHKNGWWGATPVVRDSPWFSTSGYTNREIYYNDPGGTPYSEYNDIVKTLCHLVEVLKSYGMLG